MSESNTEKALAILSQQDSGALVPGTPWTRGQAMTLVRTVAPGLSPDEFKLFAYRCEFTRLDPFAGQIHAVIRGQGDKRKLCIQTGIDGLRLIAHRTGQCMGIDDPRFEYDDRKKPISATCTVYRLIAGQRCGFTATARWAEFFPGGSQGFMWDGKPHVMLGKCAEAQALRKAFPAEMSTVYAEEEIAAPEAQPRQSEGAKALETALSEAAPAQAASDPVEAEFTESKPEPQPPPPAAPKPATFDLRDFQHYAAGYKAVMGEGPYHETLRAFSHDGTGKSDSVNPDKYDLALTSLHTGAKAASKVPFPTRQHFEGATDMKRDELLETIPAMEQRIDDAEALRRLYLGEVPVEKALVTALRLYYARLSDLAWDAAPDADLFGE